MRLAAISEEAMGSKPGTERRVVSATPMCDESVLEATKNARADLHEREEAQTTTMAHILEQAFPGYSNHWGINEQRWGRMKLERCK